MYDEFNIAKDGLFLGTFPGKISQCSCHFEKHMLEMKYSSSKKILTVDKVIAVNTSPQKSHRCFTRHNASC